MQYIRFPSYNCTEPQYRTNCVKVILQLFLLSFKTSYFAYRLGDAIFILSVKEYTVLSVILVATDFETTPSHRRFFMTPALKSEYRNNCVKCILQIFYFYFRWKCHISLIVITKEKRLYFCITSVGILVTDSASISLAISLNKLKSWVNMFVSKDVILVTGIKVAWAKQWYSNMPH